MSGLIPLIWLLFSLPLAQATEPLPPRLEVQALPILAANTDMGVLLGGLGWFSKLDPSCAPFCWHVEVQLSASIKQGPEGLELPVHMDYVALDLPGFLDGRLRLRADLSYFRVINAGYYGLGNRPQLTLPTGSSPTDPLPPRWFQLRQTQANLWLEARYTLSQRAKAMGGLVVGYIAPNPYPESLLQTQGQELDGAGNPLLLGIDPRPNLLLAAGWMWDSRDHELVPTSGMLHQLELRAAPCPLVGDDLCYAGLTLSSRIYAPLLGEKLGLAARVYGDILVGQVPVMALSKGGTFPVVSMLGGSFGVRGIPDGRYRGPLKLMGNLELRSWLLPFRLGRQRFVLGGALFADAGRVWSGFRPDAALDGEGLGLKYSLGGGPRLRWGELVVIRYDMAWCPDTRNLSPAFPGGIYLDLGQPF